MFGKNTCDTKPIDQLLLPEQLMGRPDVRLGDDPINMHVDYARWATSQLLLIHVYVMGYITYAICMALEAKS